ncbi:hypothetical protein D9M71_767500 [compost metagenome]
MGSDKAGDSLQGRDLFVAPQAQVLGSDASVGADGRRFAENQAGPPDGAAAQMNEVPVIGQAIDTGVLAHGRNSDSVGQGQLTQGVGFKQQTHGAPLKSSGKAPGSV